MKKFFAGAGATILSGVGFFADAFDLFVINIVKNILAVLYPQSAAQSAGLATAALVGAVFGQLVFGALADQLGRRVIFVATISLVILASIGSALCFDSAAVNIYTQLFIWRGLLGFAIGGEYPLAATVTAEKAESRSDGSRGRSIASVFAMQGVGNVVACALTAALLAAGFPLDITWRVALACGALPGLLTVYFRWQMEETEQFSALSASRASSSSNLAAVAQEGTSQGRPLLLAGAAATEDAGPDSQPASLQRTLSLLWECAWALAGTAGSWFLFDVVFYGNGLFTATILSQIGFAAGKVGSQTTPELAQLALGSLCIAGIGLPGYIVAVALIDRMGRRPMQLMGFAAITLLFVVLAAALPQLETMAGLFVFIYGLTFFFANFGPNTTTFVLPAEAFRTEIRATAHGISAASGKIGAAIGGALMAPMLTAWGTDDAGKMTGLRAVLGLCAAVGLLGTLWTAVFTKETAGKSLETIAADSATSPRAFSGFSSPRRSPSVIGMSALSPPA